MLHRLTTRWFATNKLPPKIKYDAKGEKNIISWPGHRNSIRAICAGFAGYLYCIYHVDSNSLLGRYKKYSLATFGIIFAIMSYRFSKFMPRLSLLEGGQLVRIEKLPMFGWGHLKKQTIPVASIYGVKPYGVKSWRNPFGFGKGFFKIVYDRKFMGLVSVKEYAIFKIPKDYDKELFKLVAIGKPVTEKTLYELRKGNKGTSVDFI
jgi:hypothetical protein